MWSIYKNIKPYVTTHFINNQIDSGRIIFQQKVKVSLDDRIEDIKLKTSQIEYEQLEKLCKKYWNWKKLKSLQKKYLIIKISNKPMKEEYQIKVYNKFDLWKKEISKIDFANLKHQYQLYKKDIDRSISKVTKNCNFIMGQEIQELEKKLQKFTSVGHAITCSSGTDALLLAMMAIDIKPGDEIITTPFTWISTAEMIALLKAKPVFVDIEFDTYNINADLIESAITKKTKAIMPVSLFGQPADIDKINLIAKRHGLKVIIDGAQSFGSTYKNFSDSNLGDISTTSFFPQNL